MHSKSSPHLFMLPVTFLESSHKLPTSPKLTYVEQKSNVKLSLVINFKMNWVSAYAEKLRLLDVFAAI
jgi:hypothetical protein